VFLQSVHPVLLGVERGGMFATHFQLCDLSYFRRMARGGHALPLYALRAVTPETREDVLRTNLSGIFKLNNVFERTISCNNKSGLNLKIPDTAKEIMYFKINLLCIIELINHFQVY
jgi:hypothetical protein